MFAYVETDHKNFNSRSIILGTPSTKKSLTTKCVKLA